MYYFKFKDRLLAEVYFTGLFFHIEKIYCSALVLPMLRGDREFNNWLANRRTPVTRVNSLELLKTAGVRTDEDFVNATYCLSLSDCLWLCDDNSRKWDDVSLFSNPFNKVYTEIASGVHGFTGGVVRTPSPELTVGGSSLKWCRRRNGGIVFYKSFGGMAELEFSGSYAEFFSSQLCRFLGLGSYVDYGLEMVDGKLCSVSSCYTSEEKSEVFVGYLCDDARHLDTHIEKYRGMLEIGFRDMMIMDCLLFNVDRHDENMGFMYDNDFNIIGLSPIYDFDHSLFYDLPLVGRGNDYIFEKVFSYLPKTYNDHTFTDQFRVCIYPDMYRRLERAYYEFSFSNSLEYPLSSGRLDKINQLFKWNLGRLLHSVGNSV